MSEISSRTKNLISQYQVWHQSLQKKEGISTIHVDEVASKVAAFYEKIRMIVDWKEEHLMRRTAIIRKLKRRFLEIDLKNPSLDKNIAEPLILELIRGGHFPNDSVPESKTNSVQKIINKYLIILRDSPPTASNREELQFYSWIIEIAACEIEENLASSRKEKALIEYMFELMKERIVLSEGIIKTEGLQENEKNILIYIAIQEALFKLDHPIISYNLIKYQNPQWNNPTPELLSNYSKNILQIWNETEGYLSHPLGKKFYTVCEKYDTPYLLLGDILTEENPTEILQKILQPEVLEELVTNVYGKRFSTLKKRIFRAAFYSTLSVLLANILSLFIIEVPLAKLITGKFTPLAMVIDVFDATILMFLLMITIRLPSRNNLNVAVMETMKIVYQREEHDVYTIKTPRKKGFFTKLIISSIYSLSGIVFLVGLSWLLNFAKFPPTSVFVNVVGTALMLSAGIIVRKKGEELTIEQKASGFTGFIFDIFSLPAASIGRWLSNKWKKYNAIAAFFNALIDMPFTIFVEFLEQWRFFLKEKKEEIH